MSAPPEEVESIVIVSLIASAEMEILFPEIKVNIASDVPATTNVPLAFTVPNAFPPVVLNGRIVPLACL